MNGNVFAHAGTRKTFDNRIARLVRTGWCIIQLYRCGLRRSGVAGIYWLMSSNDGVPTKWRGYLSAGLDLQDALRMPAWWEWHPLYERSLNQ